MKCFLQFVIYKEIKKRFFGHLWLDVVSKCDLLKEAPVIFITEDVDDNDLELAKYRKSGPDGAIRVSIKSEIGLIEVPSLWQVFSPSIISFDHFFELLIIVKSYFVVGFQIHLFDTSYFPNNFQFSNWCFGLQLKGRVHELLRLQTARIQAQDTNEENRQVLTWGDCFCDCISFYQNFWQKYW